MKSWVLAVGLLAAAASTQALAADLGDGPPDRYGSAYEDPRYSDMYRYPDARRQGPAYEEREDYVAPRRYSDVRPGRCLPREEVRFRLHEQGWRDFRDPELRGEFASVIARRPSGRLFELTLERCTGEIVSVHRVEGRPYGPYAYGAGPRRWDRPY